MPAKGKGARAVRRIEKQEAHRKRVPSQPDGQPQGKHLTGFKGMKAEGSCTCGGCHPNAQAGKEKVVIVYA